MRGRYPHECIEAKYFSHTLCHEDPADGFGARVDGLVDQGWCPPEVAKIAEGDVPRIRTESVDIGDFVFFAFGGVEVGMSEVAVGESVGRGFEPNYYGVDFAQGAD